MFETIFRRIDLEDTGKLPKDELLKFCDRVIKGETEQIIDWISLYAERTKEAEDRRKQKEKEVIIESILSKYDKNKLGALNAAEFNQFIGDTMRSRGKSVSLED